MYEIYPTPVYRAVIDGIAVSGMLPRIENPEDLAQALQIILTSTGKGAIVTVDPNYNPNPVPFNGMVTLYDTLHLKITPGNNPPITIQTYDYLPICEELATPFCETFALTGLSLRLNGGRYVFDNTTQPLLYSEISIGQATYALNVGLNLVPITGAKFDLLDAYRPATACVLTMSPGKWYRIEYGSDLTGGYSTGTEDRSGATGTGYVFYGDHVGYPTLTPVDVWQPVPANRGYSFRQDNTPYYRLQANTNQISVGVKLTHDGTVTDALFLTGMGQVIVTEFDHLDLFKYNQVSGLTFAMTDTVGGKINVFVVTPETDVVLSRAFNPTAGARGVMISTTYDLSNFSLVEQLFDPLADDTVWPDYPLQAGQTYYLFQGVINGQRWIHPDLVSDGGVFTMTPSNP